MIILNFKSYFNKRYNTLDNPFFNDFFFQDSLLHYDFYKKDYFGKRFRKNQEQMNLLFDEMDSLKNSFFGKQFRGYNKQGNNP